MAFFKGVLSAFHVRNDKLPHPNEKRAYRANEVANFAFSCVSCVRGSRYSRVCEEKTHKHQTNHAGTLMQHCRMESPRGDFCRKIPIVPA